MDDNDERRLKEILFDVLSKSEAYTVAGLAPTETIRRLLLNQLHFSIMCVKFSKTFETMTEAQQAEVLF